MQATLCQCYGRLVLQYFLRAAITFELGFILLDVLCVSSAFAMKFTSRAQHLHCLACLAFYALSVAASR